MGHPILDDSYGSALSPLLSHRIHTGRTHPDL